MKIEIPLLIILALVLTFICSMCLICEKEKTKREIIKCKNELDIKKLEIESQ